MSVATEPEITLALDGNRRVPVLLFAGDTTGLAFLASTERERSICVRLGELAEAAGLSALAFAGDIGAEPVIAASRGAGLLARLGVENAVLVAFGDFAAPALRAASATFAALVLVAPQISSDDIEEFLGDVPIPKLVAVRANDAVEQETAAALFRQAVGPIVIRHLPGNDITASDVLGMVAETTISFAIGVCGVGRSV
jgi:hypothetical protein